LTDAIPIPRNIGIVENILKSQVLIETHFVPVPEVKILVATYKSSNIHEIAEEFIVPRIMEII